MRCHTPFTYLAFSLLLPAQELAPPPFAPEFDQAVAQTPKSSALRSAAASPWLDTSDREAVRLSYLSAIKATVNVAIGWTGQIASCTPGATSQEYKDAALARINWFRGMAGVPANVTFSSNLNANSQSSALIMSANRALSHYPPSTWTCYSSTGAEAASKSNICYIYGFSDTGCVAGYMRDDGSSNYAVGHRRWILYPPTTVMGTGDVAQNGIYPFTNSLWVLPSTYLPRPATRDPFVAWPPRGYVPYQTIFNRWSFSYPGATFNQTTVTVTRAGQPLTVTLENQAQGYGENSIVWTVSSPGVGPGLDVRFQVTISNVGTSSGLQTFQYEVIAMDPDAAATAPPPPTPPAPPPGAAAVFIDNSGILRLTRAADSAAPGTGGALTGTPSSALAPNGDLIAAARDSSGAIWVNRFSFPQNAWTGWVALGGQFAGNPSLGVTSDGIAVLAARDRWNAYWMNTWSPTNGASGWTHLGGVFGSDPSVGAGTLGRAYVTGRDSWSALWCAGWSPATGFSGWRFLGGIIQGTPSLSVGTDGIAYIAARDNYNATWLARADFDAWLGWTPGSGVAGLDPTIVTLGNGALRMIILDPGGAPYYRDFNQGSATPAANWVSVGGVLREVAGIVVNGEAYFVGRNIHGSVWWYRLATSEWTRLTATVTAASPVH
jgi:hypothetical protein